MASTILIPIKEPSRVKTRLGQFLTLEERQRLVWAMFEDVCKAVADSTKASCVFIVTNFTMAARHAEGFGFEALLETTQESESASVDSASQILRARGIEAVMRLPADIPLVQAEDIDRLLALDLARPGALLVPSHEGTGTNAILRTPPDLFPSRFGPGSLALHQQEAARAGVQCTLVHNERIALDIDEPKDLALFLSLGQKTTSYALLEEMRVAERLTNNLLAD
jgi:2-phospho-L-lactate guanylyltransferase